MGLPDNVKVAIAGVFVVATAIIGAVIAGPSASYDLAGPHPISDPPKDGPRFAAWPGPDDGPDPILSAADRFALPVRPEVEQIALGGGSGGFDMARSIEGAVWPLRGFPDWAADQTNVSARSGR